MPRRKLEFQGFDGSLLSGLLEHPHHSPHACVLFAHCFSCGKDIAAASRISRAMVARGFAVLRFDFTGLGNSDGDFANTNFSSNVQDLVKAASCLAEELKAPEILIGHSLGGTAVLAAAGMIDACRAIVTIGAPFDPEHVTKQFGVNLKSIEEQGESEVDLGGRKFTIKKQFLEDVTVKLSHTRDHVTDCEGCEDQPRKLETLDREISFKGDLSKAEKKRLMEIADKCPVHRTLLGEISITSRMVESS